MRQVDHETLLYMHLHPIRRDMSREAKKKNGISDFNFWSGLLYYYRRKNGPINQESVALTATLPTGMGTAPWHCKCTPFQFGMVLHKKALFLISHPG